MKKLTKQCRTTLPCLFATLPSTAAVALVLFFASSAFAQGFCLECYDIYAVNLKSGEISRLTSIPDAGEFNPRWSNDGRFIVHDVVTATTHDLYVTDVQTGISKPLDGGEGGNDGAWSPNGKVIAFDRTVSNDPTVYTVDSGGGTPVAVRGNASYPRWSQDSRRLVFEDLTDGSIRSISITSGDEAVIATGRRPEWSPNGKYIAFTNGGRIWIIEVDQVGRPVGHPIQVTSDENVFDETPTWSNNSKALAYQSCGSSGCDIWMVSIDGGSPTLLAGGDADFDPGFSNDGRFVAYDGFTNPSAGKSGASSAALVDSGELPGTLSLARTIQIPLTQRRASLSVFWNSNR